VRVRPGSGLGILPDEASSSYAEPVALEGIPDELRTRVVGGDLLTVARTNRASTVHRQARMIYVGVKRVSGDGAITGEDRLIGLFAQKAYAEPASSIPVLRRKLRQILELEDVVDHSHDERTLRTLFEAQWADGRVPHIVFDPDVVYDETWDRWVGVHTRRSASGSDTQRRYFLWVSTSSNPCGTYFLYTVNFGGGPFNNGDWADYPHIGFDQDTIFVTANVFDLPTGGFKGAMIHGLANGAFLDERRFWPIFSGVIIVEAQKRLYQGLPVAKRASRRVFVPVMSPQGARTARVTPAP
jgi:hypothetical protein